MLVAVHATNNPRCASVLTASIRKVLARHRPYLGGTLPVKSYTFLAYYTQWLEL